MVLIIALKGQRFSLPLEVVIEIFLASPPRSVVRAPFGCLGWVEVRGEAVPLLDLATLLGLRRPLSKAAAGSEYLNRSIILTRVAESPLCLLVDEVVDVFDPSRMERLEDRVEGLEEGATGLSPGERGQTLDLEQLVAPVRRRMLSRLSMEGR